MTENWDFYFARVDDRPASLFVDLGAVEEAPIERLPTMAYVRVEMNAPRPGLRPAVSSTPAGAALRFVERPALGRFAPADRVVAISLPPTSSRPLGAALRAGYSSALVRCDRLPITGPAPDTGRIGVRLSDLAPRQP